MFSDEKMLLNLRLKYLERFVDKFIIVEACYFHNGQPKKLNFNINEFAEFKHKIEYVVVKDHPPGIITENKDDEILQRDKKKIFNSILRDNYQRDRLTQELQNLDFDDLIIISDLDEIPKLETINFKNIDNEILIFKQKMFYYKFNLVYENFIWYGSKAIKKKNFFSAQWLRNIKSKRYPPWRLDIFFSKKKYKNIKFIEDGGWHFTCIKKPREIHEKLLTFAHHQDYENSNIKLNELIKKIEDKKILYDHNVDKKSQNKWFTDKTLKKVNLEILPDIISFEKETYKEWID
tara:strand:+ start:639 stop:1511 length:873 start_codon:yes stop_codon:yes gene_type:complete